jgi:cysteine-rich repeat protein
MRTLFRVGLAGLLFGGCAGDDAAVPTSTYGQQLSSDATNGGVPGFYFLAPLGTPPASFPGTFDATLKKRLTISLMDVDCAGQNNVGSIVQTYNTVQVYPAAEQYKVTHLAAAATYTVGNCYRIVPTLDSVSLGFVDIQITNAASPPPPAGYKKWGVDSQKAIAFRLENMDPDADGILSTLDNCDFLANPDQADGDSDGIGDACQTNDADSDGVVDLSDNCPIDANANQLDTDSDGAGDACDACPGDADDDVDADGVCGDIDNCPADPNADQADADTDGIGDVCDQPCANLTNVLGYWPGNGSAVAATGTGVDGVFSGAATFAAGKFGGGFSFTGSNFVRANGLDYQGPFTISLYAKADVLQTANFGLLSSLQTRNPTSDTFQIDWNATKGYRFKVGGNTAPNLAVNIGTASLTAFQHLVVTYDGTSAIAVYLDGVQTGTATWIGPPLRFSSLKLGTNRAENYHYRGTLDDVLVIDHAASPAEVAALFAQPASCSLGSGVCGDGLVQFDNSEECDDGNTTDGDGCDSSCISEPFQTTPPVDVTQTINGNLQCTTAVANAARKIAVDSSGTIYAVMDCQSVGTLVTSLDRGATFTAPIDLSTATGAPILQIAVASGPSGVAYVAMMDTNVNVWFRVSTDSGATWSAPVLLGGGASSSAGLSLQSFNDDVYVGWAAGGGIQVARNHARGVGTFDLTAVGMSVVFFDLLYDVVSETLVVAADDPAFHIRASIDNGVTFANEVNPPGDEFFSDWAIANNQIFVSGTNLGGIGATGVYVIPTSALTTSTFVAGLPNVNTSQSRSVSADAEGNAFVSSQLDGGGVQLDRLPFGTTTFDTPRLLSATGTSPVAGPLPGGHGVAVIYTEGTSVFITVQAY